MITPYRRPPTPKPFGLLRRDDSVVLDDGRCWSLRSVPVDLTLYTDRIDAMARVTCGQGEALVWNDTPYRWEYLGRHVELLGGAPGDGPEVMRGLLDWHAWAQSFGAVARTPRSTSMSLLRATITRKLPTDGGDRPMIRDVIGGRQTPLRSPGHYPDVSHWDLEAAYARTMGEMRYGGRWWDVGPGRPTDDCPAICRAEVRTPPGALGVLPARRQWPYRPGAARSGMGRFRPYPTDGQRMKGFWMLDELRAAEDGGAHVRYLNTWICPDRGRRPFAPWWDAIQAGRSIEGYGGRLVKQTGNTLWSSFVMSGERWRMSFVDGHRLKVPEPHKGTPPTSPLLAECVTSAVRTRLLADLLIPHAEETISVHTDGGLVDGEVDLPRGWRMKWQADMVTYLNPQTYAYRVGDQTHYVMAGADPAKAPGIFASLCELVLDYPRSLRVPKPEREAYHRIMEAFPGTTIARAEPDWEA